MSSKSQVDRAPVDHLLVPFPLRFPTKSTWVFVQGICFEPCHDRSLIPGRALLSIRFSQLVPSLIASDVFCTTMSLTVDANKTARRVGSPKADTLVLPPTCDMVVVVAEDLAHGVWVV